MTEARDRGAGILAGCRRLLPAFLLIVVYLLLWLRTPPLLAIVPDSMGYLLPALSALGGEDFALQSGRSLLYPLALFAVLKTGFGFRALLGVQFVALAATTLIFWMSWARLDAGVPAWARRVHPWVGAALLLLLLGYVPLQFGVHLVLPEAMYSLGAALSMWLLLLSSEAGEGAVSAWRRLALPAAGIVVAAANYFLKPSWGVAMIVLVAWFALVAVRRGRAAPWKTAVTLLGAGLVIAVAFAVPQRLLSARHGASWSRIFGPATAFCNHLDIVLPVLESGESAGAVEDREFARALRVWLADVRSRGREDWPLLGYVGDRCLYDPYLHGLVNARFDNDTESARAFFLEAFRRGVLRAPGRYAAKVARQLWYALAHPLPNAWGFGVGEESLPQDLPTREALLAHARGVVLRGVFFPPFLALGKGVGYAFVRVTAALNEAAPFILLAALVAAASDLLTAGADRAARLGGIARAGLPVGLHVASLLTVALVHTFDISRYLDAVVPLALLSIGAQLQIAVGAGTAVVSRARRRRPSA